MKQPHSKDLVHPNQLLDLWMGPENEPAPRRPGLPPAARLAIALVVVVAVVLMAKYALDVLAMIAALVAVGLVLHILGIRLAESDILSPGWFLIIVLAVALMGYALFVPASSVAGLGRYMPTWMTQALEWSEERGWAGRVLAGPGGGGTGPAAAPVESAPPSPSTGSAGSSGGASAPPLTLTASSSTSQQGQIVTLMARLPADDGTTQQVVFYDGLTRLGAANVRTEGRVRIAYLGVRGLAVGDHEFRADVGGLLGAGEQRSATLRHTVLPRTR